MVAERAGWKGVPLMMGDRANEVHNEVVTSLYSLQAEHFMEIVNDQPIFANHAHKRRDWRVCCSHDAFHSSRNGVCFAVTLLDSEYDEHVTFKNYLFRCDISCAFMCLAICSISWTGEETKESGWR
jgi:hypothetical protein